VLLLDVLLLEELVLDVLVLELTDDTEEMDVTGRDRQSGRDRTGVLKTITTDTDIAPPSMGATTTCSLPRATVNNAHKVTQRTMEVGGRENMIDDIQRSESKRCRGFNCNIGIPQESSYIYLNVKELSSR
jgi:hypothetical protein